MLTTTMTYDEMYREINRDFVNVQRWTVHQGKRIKRIAYNARKFPIVLTISHTSPLRNNWTLLMVIRKKIRRPDDFYNVLFTQLQTAGGNYYFLASPRTDGSIKMAIYLPHFMRRFSERMELDMSGQTLAERYFLFNDSGAFVTKPDGEHERCLCTNEGIGLGEDLNDRMFLAKTFIRYDMSMGWQRDAFERAHDRKTFAEGTIMPVALDDIRYAAIGEHYKIRSEKDKHIF